VPPSPEVTEFRIVQGQAEIAWAGSGRERRTKSDRRTIAERTANRVANVGKQAGSHNHVFAVRKVDRTFNDIGGARWPLFARAFDTPVELILKRRPCAIETWAVPGAVTIYLAIREMLSIKNDNRRREVE
jgi:hypothetical protein